MAKEHAALNFSERLALKDHFHLLVPGTFQFLLSPSNRTEDFLPITWETVSVDALALRKL
jgi:hypothetical protein